MSLTQLAIGLYLIPGSSDGDGNPYTVFRLLGSESWVVQDSRGRVVSKHFTRHDAVKSVEVNG